MIEKPTLKDIWNRVKEETNPHKWVDVYRTVAKSKGYSLKQMNEYLGTIFKKLEIYDGCDADIGVSDKTIIPGPGDYGMANAPDNMYDMTEKLLFQKPENTDMGVLE